MDQKLRALKRDFHQSIPTHFSERDRERILLNIQNQNKNRGLFPKTITVFAFLTTVLLILILFSKEGLNLFEANQGGSPGGLSKGNLTGKEMLDIDWESNDEEVYKTKLSKKIRVTFNYHLVSPGETYDLFTVTKVEEREGRKIVSFESDEIIYLDGNLIYQDEWLFQFNESLHGLSRIPIEINDLGNSVQFKVEDEIHIMGEYVGFSKEKFFPQISLRTKQIDYIFSEEGSEILIHIFNGDEEPELYTTPLEIDQKIIDIYNDYRHQQDQSLLKDFEPIDLLKFYLHSATEKDEATLRTLFSNSSTEDLYALSTIFSKVDQFLLVENIETGIISVYFDYEPFVDLIIARNGDGIWKMYHFIHDEDS